MGMDGIGILFCYGAVGFGFAFLLMMYSLATDALFMDILSVYLVSLRFR
jgi:hypothetical protein